MNKIIKSLLTIFTLLLAVLFIGCTKEPDVVNVNEITISGQTTMKVGEQQTLTFEVKPADATEKGVLWSSSDDAIATVSDAVVTALAAGEVTITVNSKDGKATNSFKITIEEVKEEITAETIKTKLQSTYDAYIKANKAAVKLSIVNGESTLDTRLSFEKEQGLYKALAFDQSGAQEAGVYVKDSKVYMNANGTKQKYDLDELENETLVNNYGIVALLNKAVSFYNENAFFAALTLTSQEDNVYTFELDIAKYNGSVINVNGKDKIELIVTLVEEEISVVTLKVAEGAVVNSITTEYLGFNDAIVYPNDLSDYN